MTVTTIQKFEVRPTRIIASASGSSPSPLGDKYDDDFGIDFSGSAIPQQLSVWLRDARTGSTGCIPRCLTTPIQEQALCYFARSFGSIPGGPVGTTVTFGSLCKLRDTYSNSHPLQISLTAASLAALSTRRNCRRLRLDAQRCYSLALRSVNKAIQIPNAVCSNDVMAAVLALAFYESLTSADLAGFYHHLQGATTLANARGKDLARDPIGVEFVKLMSIELGKNSVMQTTSRFNHNEKIWEQWSTRPFINKNMQKGKKYSMPIRTRDLKEEARRVAERKPNRQVPADKDESIVARFIQEARSVMGDIAMFDASSTNKVKIFVDRSQQLLTRFANVDMLSGDGKTNFMVYRRQGLANTFSPDANRNSDPLPHFGPVYVFNSTASAMAVVGASAASLTISHLLSRCTARIHPNGQHVKSREYHTAVVAAERALEKIVGSTSWILGWRPPTSRAHQWQQENDAEDEGGVEDEENSEEFDDRSHSSRARSLGQRGQSWSWEEQISEDSISLIFFFLWPIFSAASSEFATPAQRQYLVSAMRYMDHERGMKQAGALIKVIEGEYNNAALTSLVTNASNSLSDIAGLMY